MGRRCSLALAMVLVFSVALSGTPSNASVSVVASVPGSFQVGYATPVVVAPADGPLLHANTDILPHNVIAFGVYGSDDQPWCDDTPEGQCPLFWSDLIYNGEVAPVLGLEYTESATTYPFYCSVHPNRQRGILIVV